MVYNGITATGLSWFYPDTGREDSVMLSVGLAVAVLKVRALKPLVAVMGVCLAAYLG